MRKMYDIITAVILSLGAIISVAIFSNAIDNINKKSDVIIVKGYAEYEKNVEEYSLIVSIKSKSKELDTLYENIYNKEDKVLENLEYKYVKKPFNLNSVFKEDSEVIQSYEMLFEYEFKAKKLDEIEKIKEELTKRVVQIKGASISDIQMKYAKLDENLLINKAIKDAKDKAYSIVKENGKSLGNVKEIYQDKVIDKGSHVSVIITISYEIN